MDSLASLNIPAYGNNSPDIQQVLGLIKGGYFSEGEKTLFCSLVDDLMTFASDSYLHLLYFESYIQCQQFASDLFKTPNQWQEKRF